MMKEEPPPEPNGESAEPEAPAAATENGVGVAASSGGASGEAPLETKSHRSGPRSVAGTDASGVGFSRPDQVFDLSMDYDEAGDDDTLLSWELYAGMRRTKCCGVDITWLTRLLPCLPWVPPAWWYRYSRSQRRAILAAARWLGGGAGLLLLLGIAIALLYSGGPPPGVPGGGLVLPPDYAAKGGGEMGPVDAEELFDPRKVDLAKHPECAWTQWALPRNVTPLAYELDLQTDLDKRRNVSGSVLIHLAVHAPTPCLVLHASGLEVSHFNLEEPHRHGQASWNHTLQQVTLHFPRDVEPPRASVHLVFSYALRDNMAGFYRSTFVDEAGKEQVMASTHFEATSARTAFPCFDEPDLKANFTVALTSPTGHATLSNMPERNSSTVGEGRLTRHNFAPTPPMPPYLLAWVVGNLSQVSGMLPHPLGGPPRQVTVWGTPNRLGSLWGPLDIAKRVLPLWERLLGIPYALPKLDLVALPEFSAGAMENWGLVLFREADVLLSGTGDSLVAERRTARVIAHELSHLWFGDLSTLARWGELWLQEGPATYLENVGATAARPALQFLPHFFAEVTRAGLIADARNASTRPLSLPEDVKSPDQVAAQFDSLAYEKGGSVLRMLRAWLARDGVGAGATPGTAPGPGSGPLLLRRRRHHHRRRRHRRRRRTLLQAMPAALAPSATPVPDLGSPEEPFFKGMHAYLEATKYGSTTAATLWRVLGEALGQPVGAWMEAWTFRPGFPLVSVGLGGPSGLDVLVQQAGFTSSGTLPCSEAATPLQGSVKPWWIPLGTRTGAAPAIAWTSTQHCRETAPVATLKNASDWVKVNADQLGFFRVNYTEALWGRLIRAAGPAANASAAAGAAPAPATGAAGTLGARVLGPTDVAGLLDDAWALVGAGGLRMGMLLNLTRAAAQRPQAEYSPWRVLAPFLVEVGHLLGSSPDAPAGCLDAWQGFVRGKLLAPARASLGLTSAALFESGGVAPGANLTLGRPVNQRLLQPLLLRLAGEVKDADVQPQAVTALKGMLEGTPLGLDVQDAVLALAVQGGGSGEYQTVQGLYLNASDVHVRKGALAALAYATGDGIAQTLAFALGPDVRAQDTADLVEDVAYPGGASLTAAWAFLQERWDDLYSKLGADGEAATIMGELLQRVGQQLTGADSAAQVDALFEKHKGVMSEQRYAATAKEGIASRRRWLQRHQADTCAWLAASPP